MKNPPHTLRIHSFIRSLHREGNIEHQMSSLSQLGEPAIPYLIKALGDSGRLGENAVRVLIVMGESAIPYLGEALKSKKVEIWHNAIGTLARMGTPAIPRLIHATGYNESPDVRVKAADALVGIGEPALPQLLASLEDSWVLREMLPSMVLKEMEPSSPNSLRLLAGSIRFLKREQLKNRAGQSDVGSLVKIYGKWKLHLMQAANERHNGMQAPPPRFRRPHSKAARNNAATQRKAAIGGVNR